MGILSNLLRGWQKRRLERVLESNPRPPAEVFLRLAAIYQEANDYTAASRTAKRGQSLYPRNLEMARASKNLERVVRELEKERLRQKIESYPNPILYARLAELYKTDGQVDAAVKVCQAGIRAFPDYGGSFLLLGQMCYERGDYEGARGHLEQATELDHYNYMALKVLADTYMKLSRPADAIGKLEAILYFAPGDEQVIEALKTAKKAAGIPEPAAPPQPAKPSTTVVEPAAKPARAAAFETRTRRVHAMREESLAAAIDAFKRLSGVRGVLLVDAYGLVIASYLPQDVDEELAGAMITNIYRATARSAEKMALGAFENGVIEGKSGNIHIVAVTDMVLAVFAEASVKMGLLEKAVREFAGAVLEVG